jgi:hypothetical protein
VLLPVVVPTLAEQIQAAVRLMPVLMPVATHVVLIPAAVLPRLAATLAETHVAWIRAAVLPMLAAMPVATLAVWIRAAVLRLPVATDVAMAVAAPAVNAATSPAAKLLS